MVAQSLTRPYPVTIPMIALVSLVPFYIYIPELMPHRTLHVPELAGVAFIVFLRNYRREEIPELERRLAPVLALCIIGFLGLVVGGFWVGYKLTG